MSAADHCGRLLVVALTGTLIGCAGSHGARCADPVATGQYTLAILPLLEGGYHGERFELAADGTFAGHLGRYFGDLPESPTRCDGTLTSEESERLTAAINEGEFFCRGNTFDPTVSEAPYSDFQLRMIDGSPANRFCGHIILPCFDPALSALAGAARAPLERVREEGGCLGEPYDVPSTTESCSLWPRPPPRPPPP